MRRRDDIGLDLHEYGDSGLLVAVCGGSYASRWRHAQVLAQALRRSASSGLEDVVSTYEDVFVAFDPVNTDHAAVEAIIRTVAGTLEEDAAAGMGGCTFEIPVLYGDAAGPDLSSVAAEAGVSASELVRQHTASAWMVRFVAAPTGTPFTDRADGGNWDHLVARVASPRTAVPPGSVALSGHQCIIYPHRSPGGWRLIGRTPLRLVDLASDRLVPYGPGDRLVFVAVDEQRFAQLSDRPIASLEATMSGHDHDAPAVVIESVGHATRQDLGRPGLGHLGIVAHGAADRWSAQLANALVGNPYSTPLIEVTASRLVLRAAADILMVVTGADVATTRAGHAVLVGDPFVAAAGDRVVVGPPRRGLRSYVAFAGGVTGESKLGSVSPDPTLDLDSGLTAGEVVGLRACICGYHHPYLVHPVFRVTPPPFQWSATVHVEMTAGPESEEFETDALAAEWRVSDKSNHVGLRIDGPSPRRSSDREILSRGVPVGAVEVPPDGGLLLLLRGRLLTAGYPVIGVASSTSLDRLAQARSGDTVRFRSVDTRSAVQEARRRQDELLRLTRSVQNVLHAAGVVAATQIWEALPTETDC